MLKFGKFQYVKQCWTQDWKEERILGIGYKTFLGIGITEPTSDNVDKLVNEPYDDNKQEHRRAISVDTEALGSKSSWLANPKGGSGFSGLRL